MSIKEYEKKVESFGFCDGVKEYWRYTKVGEGRPRGMHKVGDEVLVEFIEVRGHRKHHYSPDRETIGEFPGKIIRITHRHKYFTYHNGDGYKYRDSWYKVRLDDGRELWLNGAFRHFIYLSSEGNNKGEN